MLSRVVSRSLSLRCMYVLDMRFVGYWSMYMKVCLVGDVGMCKMVEWEKRWFWYWREGGGVDVGVWGLGYL